LKASGKDYFQKPNFTQHLMLLCKMSLDSA